MKGLCDLSKGLVASNLRTGILNYKGALRWHLAVEAGGLMVVELSSVAGIEFR